ncbi:helix-turn-helix transcriptional regulator [Paractinoplanes lichenicola]|uniref:Helix-turn-helix transcriptional regulator n=1 Tax=Paractinoplanes lichenicola TaxID=2802976 RepID=A0ABS1VLM5_9ACTN|nr:AAA family ATPase [Actinoplanes lichenicola]MBL7255632.1 helix-turn-helix transcriptional regulator [Actinoplanes lichenicola]
MRVSALREAELAVLAGGLDAAASGSGRLLTVEGAAGTGRTTLLARAVELARARGITVLRARGNPLDLAFAFGVARQAFAPLQGAPGWESLCRGAAGLGARVLEGDDPLDGPYAATHGLFWLTVAVASRRPAVLFVDDAHWADVASQHWLAALARRVDELPLTLVLTLDAGADTPDSGTWDSGGTAPNHGTRGIGGASDSGTRGFGGAPDSGTRGLGNTPDSGTQGINGAPDRGTVGRGATPERGGVLGELTAGTVLRLGPLDAAACALLVHERFPEAAPSFVAECHAASGGNPYLLKVLLAHSDGHSAPAVGPGEVARWLSLRLSRMPDGCATLATSLAVLGPAARLTDAAALARLDPDRAAGCADALRAAGIVSSEDWSPANPMLASALTDRLGAAERGLWHARAASLLAARGSDPERTAVHLLRAEPAGRPEVVTWLRSAATRAAGRGAPESAATYLRRALEEPVTDPADDAAVRLELALALAAVRQEGAQALAYEAVARIADPGARAEAALRCGRALAISAYGAAAIAVCRLALNEPAAPDPAAPLLGAATSGIPAPPTAVDNARVDKADTTPAVDNSGAGLDRDLLLARPLVGRGGQSGGAITAKTATIERLEAEIAGAGGLDSRTRPLVRDFLRQCRERPPALGLWRVLAAVEDTFAGRAAADNLAILRPLLASGGLDGENDSVLPTVAGLTLIANGDLGTARAMSEGIAGAAGARGWLSTVAHGRFLRAQAVLPAALVTEAVADARAAVEFKVGSNTPAEGLLFALCPLVDALVEADRVTEADALLAAAFPGEPPPYGLSSPMFLQSRGRLRCAQERPVEAIADLRAAARMWDELGVRHPGVASWRADLVAPMRAAGAATRSAAKDEVEALAWEHLELAERAAAPGSLSYALRVAATVAGRDERIALLQRAVAVCEGTPERLARAYGLVGLGSALRRAGQLGAAREKLRTGLEIAAAGGASRLAARATAELHAAGARPRRAAQHGPGALTEAEQQVAGMAAGGLTNREIAARLVLSRRTIETHLAHAYHKLGIASRRDLTAALRSAGDQPA